MLHLLLHSRGEATIDMSMMSVEPSSASKQTPLDDVHPETVSMSINFQVLTGKERLCEDDQKAVRISGGMVTTESTKGPLPDRLGYLMWPKQKTSSQLLKLP